MGFIHSAECEIMRNNVLININMVQAAAAARVARFFFLSSVSIAICCSAAAAHRGRLLPAMLDNEYGWDKLYSERVA